MTLPIPPKAAPAPKFVVGTALKAIFGAATAFLTGLGTALVGAHSFAAITDGQWVTTASLTLAAFGAVYGVTNAAKS